MKLTEIHKFIINHNYFYFESSSNPQTRLIVTHQGHLRPVLVLQWYKGVTLSIVRDTRLVGLSMYLRVYSFVPGMWSPRSQVTPLSRCLSVNPLFTDEIRTAFLCRSTSHLQKSFNWKDFRLLSSPVLLVTIRVVRPLTSILLRYFHCLVHLLFYLLTLFGFQYVDRREGNQSCHESPVNRLPVSRKTKRRVDLILLFLVEN